MRDRESFERLHALDALRATAMFLGIVLHGAMSFIVAPFPWIVRDVSRGVAFDVMLGAIHGFRMQVFFFLAGFFAQLVWQRIGTRGFLAQRGKRIGLPFLLGMATIVPLAGALWIWAEGYVGRNRFNPPVEEIAAGIPTMHLWFLEMLLVLYAGAMLLAWAGEKLGRSAWAARLDAAFDWLIRLRAKPFLLVPPTVLCLWGGSIFGEVDEPGMRLMLAPRAVAYYALFFAVGWWLHRRVHQLDALRASLKTYFLVAFLAFMVLGACHQMRIRPADTNYLGVKVLALVAASLYSWSMTFAVTGLFLRIAGAHRPWMRYLADASYWCYLWHLPLVLWLQVLVAKMPLNGWLKFGFILAVTVAVLLPSYQWLVRHTWMGRMLNGPRERPSRPLPTAPA